MEVSFTLWTMKEIIKAIPFDTSTREAVHLDFLEMAVPYYVKSGFRVSIFYIDDTFPVDAACSIYSPKNVVTIIILIKRKFEDAFSEWQNKHENVDVFGLCCRRRELYCHETSHLIAIIRAFPSNRSSKVREDFKNKIRVKFENSINKAESSMSIPLISEEKPGDSPSVFDKDHFRYENDDLNYFRLYEELMLDYDTMYTTLKKICAANKPYITLDDISSETFVSPNFFRLFPERLNVLRDILKGGFD